MQPLTYRNHMFNPDIVVTVEDEGEGEFVRITNTLDDSYVNIPINSVSNVADLIWDAARNEAS